MSSKEEAEQINKELNRKPRARKVRRRDLLSTGSTLLNLACSDNPFGGLLKGKFYLFVGNSQSGKTFLSLSCLAEAVQNKYFKDYRLIYDNVEDGCLIDVDRVFSEEIADRVEPPAVDEEGEPLYSQSIEEFYYNVDDALDDGRPFIYINDSMDGLTSDAENSKFEELKKAHRGGKQTTGSYGDGKAKKNSSNLRRVVSRLRNTGSILLIVCQTRDNIGSRYGGQTYSGGKALKFYATVEVWTAVTETLKKTVMDKVRDVGVLIQAQIKKNRITGRLSKVEFSIFPSYGIDDMGSCIDFLVEEKWWPITKQTITATGLGIKGTRDKLIDQIEKAGLEDSVRSAVGECWARIQEESALKRKKRYE